MQSRSYINYASNVFKDSGVNAYGRSTFKSEKTQFSPKVAARKTYVKKLFGVEKGLYRLNFSREIQYRFLQALYSLQDARRA